MFLSAGKWQSIFSSFYALVAAPLVPLGVEWLVALAILGAVVAVTSTSCLRRRPPGCRAARCCWRRPSGSTG